MSIDIDKKKTLRLMLFAVLILATALRFYRLSYQSFWLDEVLNVNWSKLPSISQILHTLSTGDNSPPFYYLFLHFWMRLGSTEFMIRLPSVLAGIMVVFLIFKIGEAIFDRHIGLISAALTAISPFYLWVSQEARMYAFLSMFSLFSFYFFIKAIKENKLRFWAGYLIFSLFALYTHYYAFFTIFAEMVYFILNWRKFKYSIKHYSISIMVIILLFIPCLFLLFQQFLVSARRQQGLFPSTVWAVPHLFFDLSTGYSLLQIELAGFSKNILYNLTIIISSVVIFATLFISGLLYIIRRQKTLNPIILVYFFIPVIISYIISLKVHIFGSKYLSAAAAGYFIILAAGLRNLKQKWALRIFTLGLLIITAFSLFNYYYNDNFAKGGWNQAAKFIAENERSGDIILFSLPSPSVAFEYYYKGDSPLLGGVLGNNTVLNNFESLLSNYKRIWFIPDLQKIYDPDDSVRKYVAARGKIEGEYKFRNVNVIVYIINQL